MEFLPLYIDVTKQPVLVVGAGEIGLRKTRLLLEAGAGPRSLELSYLSGGLSWKTDYVARLSTDGRQMDLSGWVTLSNRSGTSYRDARLQLVAGALNRVQESAPLMVRKASVTAMRASSAPTSCASSRTAA